MSGVFVVVVVVVLVAATIATAVVVVVAVFVVVFMLAFTFTLAWMAMERGVFFFSRSIDSESSRWSPSKSIYGVRGVVVVLLLLLLPTVTFVGYRC